MQRLALLVLLLLASCAPIVSADRFVVGVMPADDGSVLVRRCRLVLDTAGWFQDVKGIGLGDCETLTLPASKQAEE